MEEPITQAPGFRLGERPPATPKLMRPEHPAAIACVSEAARFFPSPPQITGRRGSTQYAPRTPSQRPQSFGSAPGHLHTERYRSTIAAPQVAIARHRPERKESRISVIAQIEHAWKACRRVPLLIPKAMIALILHKIRDAASNGRMVHLATAMRPSKAHAVCRPCSAPSHSRDNRACRLAPSSPHPPSGF